MGFLDFYPVKHVFEDFGKELLELPDLVRPHSSALMHDGAERGFGDSERFAGAGEVVVAVIGAEKGLETVSGQWVNG